MSKTKRNGDILKSYKKGYIRYLIESDIPLFLIKEYAIKKD